MSNVRFAVVESEDPLAIEIGNDMIDRHGGCAIEALKNSPKIHSADIVLADLKRLVGEGVGVAQIGLRIKKLSAAYERSFN